ncbi:hypothetical protein RRG08_009918 [Elysia crispata]|uniref:Transmembrane protein 135 N-terminal domain-containing protein n=1 Tax=Elysia crispata TaxID=231223 RepID=A0AAE1ARP1_9GAST|nr:hypothetical protein RRG08_009918 [Elysia crispata]
MAVLSKPVWVSPTCYELGHCWTPYCTKASTDVAKNVFTEALKIYGTLYMMAGLIQKKGVRYYLRRFVPETLQSSIFLTINGTMFISMFCLWRRLVGFYLYYNVFICGIPICILSILIENKSRHMLGCMYLLTASFIPAFIAAFTAVLFERKSRAWFEMVVLAPVERPPEPVMLQCSMAACCSGLYCNVHAESSRCVAIITLTSTSIFFPSHSHLSDTINASVNKTSFSGIILDSSLGQQDQFFFYYFGIQPRSARPVFLALFWTPVSVSKTSFSFIILESSLGQQDQFFWHYSGLQSRSARPVFLLLFWNPASVSKTSFSAIILDSSLGQQDQFFFYCSGIQPRSARPVFLDSSLGQQDQFCDIIWTRSARSVY